MKIIIVNGPNLNLLGQREQSIYGERAFEPYLDELKEHYPTIKLSYFQNNVEGELINKLHEVGFDFDGIILNARGYTHTSVAIADAIAAISCPVIEVHISNVYARESYRHESLMAKNCRGVVVGFGLDSYRLALDSFIYH